MNLQFCPVCRRLLQIVNENGKNIGICECGFKRTSGVELNSEEKIENKSIGKGFVNEDTRETKKLSYEDKKERKADF